MISLTTVEIPFISGGCQSCHCVCTLDSFNKVYLGFISPTGCTTGCRSVKTSLIWEKHDMCYTTWPLEYKLKGFISHSLILTTKSGTLFPKKNEAIGELIF